MAPDRVRRLFGKTFSEDSLARPDPETDELAQAYLERGVISKTYFDDAQHVAICTLSGIRLLVSWNFKHLANLQRENAFNGVNLLHGYPEIRILILMLQKWQKFGWQGGAKTRAAIVLKYVSKRVAGPTPPRRACAV